MVTPCSGLKRNMSRLFRIMNTNENQNRTLTSEILIFDIAMTMNARTARTARILVSKVIMAANDHKRRHASLVAPLRLCTGLFLSM